MDNRDIPYRWYFLYFLIISGGILYLAAAVIGIAAILGGIYGGGYAIRNYALSFKENVIDSNRKPKVSTQK